MFMSKTHRAGWHGRCSLSTPALPRLVLLRETQEGDFDHAVDNFGDSAGLVADWLALTRWWRPHPSTARGSCDYFGH